MVLNDPSNPFQRAILFNRRTSSSSAQGRLVGVIHGSLRGEGDPEDLATLIILEFRFQSFQSSRRLRSANINFEFATSTSTSTGTPIEVYKIAPEGSLRLSPSSRRVLRTVHVTPNIAAAGIGIGGVGMNYEVIRTDDDFSTISGNIVGSQEGNPNGVQWVLAENKTQQTGLPTLFRAAILLKRKNNDQFKATFHVSTEDGSIQIFSKANKPDDPILFKPGEDMIRKEGLNIDAHHLLDCNLNDFVDVQDTDPFRMDSRIIDEGAAIQDELFHIAQGGEKTSGDTTSKVEQFETSFIELWNIVTDLLPAEEGKQDGNGDIKAPKSRVPPRVFGGLRRHEWMGSPDQSMIDYFLEWSKELLPSTESKGGDVERHDSCSLIVRTQKPSSAGLKPFQQPEPLFPKDLLDKVMDSLQLPKEYNIARGIDSGVCSPFMNDEDRNLRGYIFQTPFYSKGFWSLILGYRINETEVGACSNIVGVLRADKQDDVDKADEVDGKRRRGIESAFQDANAQARTQSHPMLLPIQLFINHFFATQIQFIDIITKMDEVETELRIDLNETDHQSESEALHDRNKVDYGELSKKLHSCNSDLVELEKRRDFERRLGKFLMAELAADGNFSQLHDRVRLYDELSQNRDLDVQSLPRRIESQRSVLYNLIGQRANEAKLKDSYAIKAISVLTILFLPGAYVATLFTTNMFTFRDGEEVWVYWAVVVPLTLFVMAFWLALMYRFTVSRGRKKAGKQS